MYKEIKSVKRKNHRTHVFNAFHRRRIKFNENKITTFIHPLELG